MRRLHTPGRLEARGLTAPSLSRWDPSDPVPKVVSSSPLASSGMGGIGGGKGGRGDRGAPTEAADSSGTVASATPGDSMTTVGLLLLSTAQRTQSAPTTTDTHSRTKVTRSAWWVPAKTRDQRGRGRRERAGILKHMSRRKRPTAESSSQSASAGNGTTPSLTAAGSVEARAIATSALVILPSLAECVDPFRVRTLKTGGRESFRIKALEETAGLRAHPCPRLPPCLRSPSSPPGRARPP